MGSKPNITDDFSCGVIPYRVIDGRREFLLVQHQAGHWAFPKGHPEEGETHLETARRELAEETGIARVALDEDRPFEEAYTFTKRSGKQVRKRVVYFVGEVVGGPSVQVQVSEIADYAWDDAERAGQRMSFDEGRALLDAAVTYLESGAAGNR